MTIVIRLADGTGLGGAVKLQMLEAAQSTVSFKVFPSQTRFPAPPPSESCRTLRGTEQMA